MDKASGAIEMSIYYYNYCYYYHCQQLQNEVTKSGVCRYFHTSIFDEQKLEIRHPPHPPPTPQFWSSGNKNAYGSGPGLAAELTAELSEVFLRGGAGCGVWLAARLTELRKQGS